MGCQTSPDIATPTSQVGMIPFHYRHHIKTIFDTCMKWFGGRLGTRTLKAFTPSRFQGGVLIQPDTFHACARLGKPAPSSPRVECILPYTISRIFGTGSETRTRTPFRAPAPKAGVTTNSTIPAYIVNFGRGREICTPTYLHTAVFEAAASTVPSYRVTWS